MEPFLKAVGGKRWLSARLAAEIMQIKPTLYVEPFAGGGAVSLAISAAVPKLISDTNPAFIAVWRALKLLPAELILAAIQATEKKYPNTGLGYAQARIAMNEHPGLTIDQPSAEFAALVLYINYRCFNGVWRVNSHGGFNVPWAKYKTTRRFELAELRQYRQVLSTIEPKRVDFRVALDELMAYRRERRPSMAIYADPPYLNTFDGYTSGGFDETDQRDLARWLKYLAEAKMRIWSTNADTPLIREIYSWARLESLDEYHSVGAKANRRGQQKCLLIRSN